MTITKKGLELALEARTLSDRMGMFGARKFADSMSNGSLFSDKFFPASILNNVDTILGKSPAHLRGTFTHPKNFAARPDEKVDVSKGEVILETDIVTDGDVMFLLSITSPGGFALIDHIFSKAGPELLVKSLSSLFTKLLSNLL